MITPSDTATRIRSAGVRTATRSSARAPGLVHPPHRTRSGRRDREQPRGAVAAEHIKEGRMGDFLANNVDWALSRAKYTGARHRSAWINDKSGKMEAPSSVDGS